MIITMNIEEEEVDKMRRIKYDESGHCKECKSLLTKKEQLLGLDTCLGCIHHDVNGTNRITDADD